MSPRAARRVGRPALRALSCAVALAVGSLTIAGAAGRADGVLLGGGGAVASVRDATSRAPQLAANAAGFTVSGGVSGLYPGVTKLLFLTIFNPQKVTITVFFVSTTVSSPSSACTSANLTVSTFNAHKAVLAKKSGVIAVYAKMAHSAPNACMGKAFALRYFAKATAP